MRKVTLLAAMLAMVLAAAVPALAQTVAQAGDGNVACVQTAVQQEVDKVQINRNGDNVIIQAIGQGCNTTVAEVNTVIDTVVTTGTATASAAPAVQYEYSAPSAAPAVQYQYSSPAAELPSTGGSSLIALGVGVLLVAGGLLARRFVR